MGEALEPFCFQGNRRVDPLLGGGFGFVDQPIGFNRAQPSLFGRGCRDVEGKALEDALELASVLGERAVDGSAQLIFERHDCAFDYTRLALKRCGWASWARTSAHVARRARGSRS